jgi:WXG100 family type VII secretion target
MAIITISPDELRQQAQTYLQTQEHIQELTQNIESMNITIAQEWRGAAFEAFINRWQDTLKPNLNVVASELEMVFQKLVQHANITEERDRQDAQSWQ